MKNEFTKGFQEHGNTTWGSNMIIIHNTPSHSMKSDEILNLTQQYLMQLNSHIFYSIQISYKAPEDKNTFLLSREPPAYFVAAGLHRITITYRGTSWIITVTLMISGLVILHHQLKISICNLMANRANFPIGYLSYENVYL